MWIDWSAAARTASAALIAAALCVGAPARAAEITISAEEAHDVARLPIENAFGETPQRRFIHLKGPIERGDAAALQQAAGFGDVDLDRIDAPLETMTVVSFDSAGGLFAEGIRLAEVIRKLNLVTLVEADAQCLSACAVAFMAGFEWIAEGQPERMRFVEIPGRLGFHRPFLDGFAMSIPASALRDLTDDEIADAFGAEFRAAYDEANELVQDMLAVDPAAWNTDLLLRMLLASGGQGDYVFLETAGDAIEWDIRPINVRDPRVDKTEARWFLRNLCLNLWKPSGAAARGWATVDRDGGLGEEPWWLERKPQDGTGERYRVMMEGLDGTGCDIAIEPDGRFISIDGQFFDFSRGGRRVFGWDPRSRLEDIAEVSPRSRGRGSRRAPR